MQALLKHNHRLTAVHLVDAHHCSDPAKFISVLLVTLSTMVQLEMPQVNLLSKIDLVEAYGELACVEAKVPCQIGGPVPDVRRWRFSTHAAHRLAGHVLVDPAGYPRPRRRMVPRVAGGR